MSRTNHTRPDPHAECPDPQQWLTVLTGCATDEQVSALEAHLAECGACETTLDAIVEDSDTCVRTLAAHPGVSEDEPEYQQLYAQLMAAPQSFRGSTSMQQLIHRLPVAVRSPGSEEPLPRQLGQYELLEPLGRGATGSVFKARHLKLDRIVALKALASRRSHDPGSVARFLQEMKAVGRLDHPHIIRATDAGESQGRHYLVMEYVEGTSVSLVLQQLRLLTVADACEIARQAALGLACAHQHGMVHRDVKPSNLLFAYSGQVKLLDLGLVAIQDGTAASLGAAGTDGAQGSDADGPRDDVTRGTADYMSPEQWTRYHDVDARSDLYSLGCTLFKLLTGVAPYHRLPVGCANTMQAHLSGEVPEVGSLRTDLPNGLRDLVTQLMAKTPADRIQTADETANQLARYARGCDLTAVARAVGGATHITTSAPATSGGSPIGTRLTRQITQQITRRRAVWLAGAIGLAGAVGALGALSGRGLLGWRRRQVQTGQWRALTPTGSEILLDLGPPDSATWRAGDAAGVWELQSQGIALLHLGQPVRGIFSLATQFQHADWEGEVGLFFRFRSTTDAGQTVRSFQTIQLVPRDAPASAGGGRREFKLLWMAHRAVLGEDGWQLTQEPWADVPVDVPASDTAAALQVVLGRRGFPEVNWNDRPLPESQWTLSFEGRRQRNLAAEQLKTAYLGHLGLVTAGGTTQFLHPRLMYHA